MGNTRKTKEKGLKTCIDQAKKLTKNGQEILQNTVSDPKIDEPDEKGYFKKDTNEGAIEQTVLPTEEINELNNIISKIYSEVFRDYLPKINTYDIVDIDNITPDKSVQILEITKLVVDKEENITDKIINIYSSLSETGSSVALAFRATTKGHRLFLIVTGRDSADIPSIQRQIDGLDSSIKGNFPGSKTKPKRYKLIANRKFSAVSMITNIASNKSEDFISQSIEKLFDGCIPAQKDHEYTLLLLARSVLPEEISAIKAEWEKYYTILSPYEKLSGTYSLTNAISILKSATNSVGVSVGVNEDVSVGMSVGVGDVGASVGVNAGANLNAGKTAGKIKTESETETLNITRTLCNVKNALERLTVQNKRLEECEALGMWEFAAYVLAEKAAVAKNVASMYRALTQGNKSFVEKTAINTWTDKEREGEVSKFKRILEYLQQFSHPRFKSKESGERGEVRGTAYISGTEMARAMGFPRKSIPGIPVYECVAFGRDVVSSREVTGNPTINIGNVYHMHQSEARSVKIDINSMTSHTFITGATGSGKSNVIYQILDKLLNRNIKFLVVEPAKGEYKEVFGGRGDVTIYGTNPEQAPLLKMNPFSFPKDVHVLEHIDRLIEILNACWPMYAAMPAILKDAVENTYKKVGWSLSISECSPRVFPTLLDLLEELPQVIESSAYSSDTKGDYTGALITRVKSLTNGLYGQLFCATDAIPDTRLFDENVIIDISRVGSMETKALLMGIIIMKLQEYRMSTKKEMNSPLKHITVLEEAHNLLRRTTAEQNQESSNLQGKSVEMISNAIAEMRTYGEGFVLADQSPGLLDMSVIRNTNTKIILRLPDESDRSLVGKAAALNDNQIIELSKLDRGVAAVYQNEWLEPVLCAFNEFKDFRPFKYDARTGNNESQKKFFQKLVETSDDYELTLEEIEEIKLWIDTLNTGINTKQRLLNNLEVQKEISKTELGMVLYNLFNGKRISNNVAQAKENENILGQIDAEIASQHGVSDLQLARNIRYLILEQIVGMPAGAELIPKLDRLYNLRGGAL